jgi:hypothetical protein
MKKYFMAIGIALAMVGSSANAGSLSSSYSFKAGHGTVPWLMVSDHDNFLARDYNGDGRLDVMGMPSTHGAQKALNGIAWNRGIAFLSNPDGSYTFTRTGAMIGNTASEYSGDYIAKGPIILGNGPGGGVSKDSFGGGSSVTEPHPGCGAQCGVYRALIFNGLNTALGPRFNWHNSAIADVNKDGKLDLIGFSAGTVIYYGLKPGGYGRHPGNGEYVDLGGYVANDGAFAGTFKDLDGDGYPEMIVASGAYFSAHNGRPVGSVTVYKNNGGTNFTPMQNIMRPVRNGVRAMYHNQGDIIMHSECGDRCGETNSIDVYATNGGGLHLKQHFRITSASGKRGHPPALVDVNGDGKKDLVVYHYQNYAGGVGSSHGGIWLNNGNGTFKQLGTPIFAGIPKAGTQGHLLPTHANGDKRIDWIVVYKDGTFGTLISPGSGGSTGNVTDKTKDKPKVKVDDHLIRGDRFWQLSFVKDQLSVMNHSIINSNSVGFSFDDTTMFKGIEFGKDMSLNFGIGQPDEYGQIEDFVAGMSFGATDITVATDNTLLGWAPGQSLLNVSDTKSRYINIRRSKSIKDWTLAGNMTYALAQGDAGYGYVKGMDDFHAMGFGVSADYVIDEDSAVKFGVSQPLRIERGALHFNDVIADMTPDGREIDYTMSYTTTVGSTSSTINLQLSYASDYNHYRNEGNAKIMAVYKGTW